MRTLTVPFVKCSWLVPPHDFALSYNGSRYGRVRVEEPVLAALEALGENAVVRVSQRELEVRDVPHESTSEHKVPFVQFESFVDVVVAKLKIRGESGLREPSLSPLAARLGFGVSACLLYTSPSPRD